MLSSFEKPKEDNIRLSQWDLCFGHYIFQLLYFNEIFMVQGQKDREHLTVCTEGFGQLLWLVVELYWPTLNDWVENQHWGCWQNIPDRPDSRLISHPFFNVTPGLRTLEDYTQIWQPGDHSGTASTWTRTQCTQNQNDVFFLVCQVGQFNGVGSGHR